MGTGSKPVANFREGNIGLSVWQREGNKGPFYELTISRSYKKKDDTYGYSTSFGESNLKALWELLGQAAEWMEKNRPAVPPNCRSVSEIVDRILGMHCLAACAYGFSREKAQAWCEREVPHNVLTEAENNFLRTGVGNKQQFMVQIEGMWALAWAVCLVDTLDFGQACSPHFVALLPDLKSGQNAVSVRSRANIRPLCDLIAENDLAYCLHWAIRQAEFDQTTLPEKIGPHVIMERRRALEWVLSSEAWDNVSLDT